MKFDFDKYPGRYVMHCKTEEEAKEFFGVMHDAWSDFGKEKESAQVKSHEHKFVVDRQRGFKSIYINGVTIAVPVETPIGIAIKNPNDEYDKEIGRSLAYYRMEGQE